MSGVRRFPRLILASASPARLRLLREAGIRVRVVVSGAPEKKRDTVPELVRENAFRKAARVSRDHPKEWVLAADTLACFEGKAIGKPASRAAAERLMHRLSGKTHALYSAFVLRRGSRIFRRTVKTMVRFRDLSPEAVKRILDRRDATRFAGGYAIRKGRDPVVGEIRGSFSNVVGLPMEVLVPILRRVAREVFK